MPDFAVRKIVTTVEQSWHDGGPRLDEPLEIGLVAAVVRNPDAGRYVEEIVPHMPALKELGLDLAKRLLAALGGDPARIQAYGKGAIVGTSGDIDYGALFAAIVITVVPVLIVYCVFQRRIAGSVSQGTFR